MPLALIPGDVTRQTNGCDLSAADECGRRSGMIVAVHLDLAPTQWVNVLDGQVAGPGETSWSRRSTRAKRAACDALIAGGAPLLLYYFGGGQLDWFDGEDANEEWARVRKSVTQTPRLRGSLEWTAGVWTDPEERALVVLTGHC